MHEIRYALRSLRRNAGVTAVAVLALALGIGANTAIFSVVNAVFLRPLPYAEAASLVEIAETSGGGGRRSVSYPNFLDWRQQAGAFEDIAAHVVYEATLFTSGSAERVPVAYVSATFFPVLRVRPVLGRDFTPGDDRQGAPPVAILSYRTWQNRFGSNRSILGAIVDIDKRLYTVVGVLPPEFRFYRIADVFIPVSDVVTRFTLYLRENHNNLYVVARLRKDATLDKAQAEMTTIAARLARAYPASNSDVGAKVFTLRERVSGDSRRPIMMLLGAVALVLLIACLNVANLLLARAADRRKEMAVRAALGASRWQVLRQLLTESLLLAVAGGVLGTLLARWSFAGLIRLVPASVAAGGLSIDPRVLGFTLLVCVVTGVLFGLAPALDAVRLNLSDAMRDGTRTTGVSSRGRLRDALVVSEIALAVVLLVGAGLLLRTLSGLMKAPLGFQTENVLTARISLPDSDTVSVEQVAAFYERLVERVQAMPGVKSVGHTSHMPLSGSFSNAVFYRDDKPIPPNKELPDADHRFTSPGYFAAMGIPLVRGRLFTPADGRVVNFQRGKLIEWFRTQKPAVVINESMARRYWPGEDPVGKTFRFGFPEMKGPRLTVIGVVGDTRDHSLDAEMPPTWYFSACHLPRQTSTLVIRTQVQPGTLISAVRRTAAELEPSVLVGDVTTLEQMVSNSVASRRLNMLLLGIFAALALVLATVGVYGVMAYAVNCRRHEIGVRMALGAMSGGILKMVIGKATLLAGLGVAAGCAAALALTRLIAGMLYGVKPADPFTFAAVAVVLFAAAVAASWVPARRATRVSPLDALRSE